MAILLDLSQSLSVVIEAQRPESILEGMLSKRMVLSSVYMSDRS